MDTNGSKPDVVRAAIEQKLVDYIAMDLKAPFEKYSLITGVEFEQHALQESMDLIRRSGLAYEFRTTYDKEILNDADIKAVSSLVQDQHYRVQECLPVAKEKAALKVMHAEL